MRFIIATLSLSIGLTAAAWMGNDLRMPKRVVVEQCFAYPAEQDPNFFRCLQNLICQPSPYINSTSGVSGLNATTASVPTTSIVSPPNPCSTSGACDCSKIVDRNSEEYFQCITNPACERCHVQQSNSTTPATTTTMSATISSSTANNITPGTYTVLNNGNSTIMVFSDAVAQATVTTTVVVTFNAESTRATTTATTESPVAGCEECHCEELQDAQGQGYFQCLSIPACEKCTSTASASAKGTSTGTGASSWRASTLRPRITMF